MGSGLADAKCTSPPADRCKSHISIRIPDENDPFAVAQFVRWNVLVSIYIVESSKNLTLLSTVPFTDHTSN